MDEDKFALVEKIIKDVDNVISKNAELYAFDIVPVESNIQNKSPVLHLENCLGLESWCIKHVYMYCYSELMDKYFSKTKRKALKITSVNSVRLKKLLNITLLLNPELSTFWNKRREMVLKCLLDKLSELHFTKLVVSRKPKCNDAFAYRRWLLDVMLQDKNLQSNCIENICNEELHICELTADKSPNNYHSWNHRMWVLKKLKTIEKQFNINYLYIKEYGFSERWTAKHISDFSCFHYRQFCIKNILTINMESWKAFESSLEINLRKTFARVIAQNFPNDATIQATEEDLILFTEDNLLHLLLCSSCKEYVSNTNKPISVCRNLEVLFYELVLNNELSRFYKCHETLWYHRRFIVHEIIVLIHDYFNLVLPNGWLMKHSCRKCAWDELRQKQAKAQRVDHDCIYSSVLYNILLSHEKHFIDDRRKDGDNYADRHEKYLKFVEGIPNIFYCKKRSELTK